MTRIALALFGFALALHGMAGPHPLSGAGKDAPRQPHRLSISLSGEWRFATDPGETGLAQHWEGDRFDDSGWQSLRSGTSWQEQGVDHYGWGWYRQQVFIPKEYEGTPVVLYLPPIPTDDDAWWNGVHIGGISGEYKYRNQISRVYTVPSSAIRYGEKNTIALRIWGGNLTFIGNRSGLTKGPLKVEADPYIVRMREPGGKAVPFGLFDLSEAQRGKPFEILFPFPAEVARDAGARLAYRLTDFPGGEILSGTAAFTPGEGGVVQAVVPIDPATAQTLYLRGRFRASLRIKDATGALLDAGTRDLDPLSFANRDLQPLPELPETWEQTPYGKLRLVDEIDASASIAQTPHPYLQGGFSNELAHMTPGSAAEVRVVGVLGKQARESGYGWFAYRIGRGKLKPHTTYLLRIEYPEDKPRFAPVEIQTGQNYMDVGWKNGVGADDVYDNWPLSGGWQWYDVIVPLDDQTVGTGGTGSAPGENGFWVYFLNKLKPNAYYAMYSGGPAVARMRLYEIDPWKNAPAIVHPEGLPRRVLSVDWERQPDHQPADLVRYAKLMGYSAVSPVILKWFFANYSEPLNGYTSIAIDDRDYWVKKEYDPASGENASAPLPGRKSQHVRYLEATRALGIDYIPRFEWGGSQDLPREARAIAASGKEAKPNRFAPWCGNLLHPAMWEDIHKLMDHLIKPYAKDHPQLAGALWRVRCDRLPISYGKADLELFSTETGIPLPGGDPARWAAWAAGEMREKYDDWWHGKRAQFHIRLARLLQSYRPDLTLYYYNWDADKFGLIEPDITGWAFVSQVVKPGPTGGRAAYERERARRKTFTAQDYIEAVRTGHFGNASRGINRADYGLRPELYRSTPGIRLFAPANYLCYADEPEYLNYFQTADGLAVSNVVSYDEVGSRTINPKYEGNMITPGGPAFSMALELLAYFHGDARTLNYTVYTYGRGFAEAHRRFAQAFLALPAIPGTVVEQGDPQVKVRTYPSPNGTYVGVAYRGYEARKLRIRLPAKAGASVRNLVSGERMEAKAADGAVELEIASGPVELHAFLITE